MSNSTIELNTDHVQQCLSIYGTNDSNSIKLAEKYMREWEKRLEFPGILLGLFDDSAQVSQKIDVLC
jgi:hypothetical protein